jgi:Flp pilus assembly protein TadD
MHPRLYRSLRRSGRTSRVICSGLRYAGSPKVTALSFARPRRSSASSASTTASDKAYEHRDRLTDRERYHTEASYYASVHSDDEKAIAAYRALLESYPDDQIALHNLAGRYDQLGQFARAEPLFRRAIELDSTSWNSYMGLLDAQVGVGKWRDAQVTLERAATHFPNNPTVEAFAYLLASSAGDYAAAEARAHTILKRYADDAFWKVVAHRALADLSAVQGKLTDAVRHQRDAMEATAEDSGATEYLMQSAVLGTFHVRL